MQLDLKDRCYIGLNDFMKIFLKSRRTQHDAIQINKKKEHFP